jgi:uncharacterized CHY-type Zn-finger protein
METIIRNKLFCGYCHKELSGYKIKEGWIFPEDHFDEDGFRCFANHILVRCGSCRKIYIVENEEELERCTFCGKIFLTT